MSFWEDQSAEEIGERVGASAGNVRVIRHRALAKLQNCMQAREAS
jgi:DNA-directed RNA polymerase specialized sigma24 family protein